jgi:protoporphyrinogen oxidase
VKPILGNAGRRIPQIAIVGGGPGGLFTAWHLEQMAAGPLEITIFETSHRLGGKVITPTFALAPIRYEAGAAEFYDYSPIGEDPLRELVDSFGLPTVALGGSRVVVGGNAITNLDDLRDVFGEQTCHEFIAFDTWARSAMTPREFFASGSDHAGSAEPGGRFEATLAALPGENLRSYVEAMIHSDLAAPPVATSVAYGLQNYLMNDPAYMRLYCIAGGNEQLIAALAARISATIGLGTTVERVAEGAPGRLRLTLQSPEGRSESDFDVVVLALPMEALGRLHFAAGPLATAMQGHLAHHDHPAHYLRITLLVDQPLQSLTGDDGYLMLDAFGGCCLYVESAREPDATHGVLGWLLGGTAAEGLSEWSDADLVAAALETLPMGLAIDCGRVLEARVHRWTGAVSSLPGGWQPLPQDRRHRPAAETHPGLFVVGDYLYDSTLNGVLDSAEHVAGCLTAELTAYVWENR